MVEEETKIKDYTVIFLKDVIVYRVRGGQVSDSLEPELQVTMSPHRVSWGLNWGAL